jgi:hypothetical protein
LFCSLFSEFWEWLIPSCGNYQRPGITSKVIFLPAGHVRNFEELVAVLGHCWSTCLTSGQVVGVDKTPDGSHQMRHGNVDTTFPKNLRDPVDTQAAAMRFQDFFLILSQCVDLRLLSITASFRATRDLTGRFVLVLKSGHAE